MDIRTRVSLWETVVVGAAAWLALNAFAYAAAPLFGISFGLTARFFGSFLFPGAGTTVQLWVGRAVFLGAAVGWGLLYRWTGSYPPGPGWLRGLVYGAGIWLVSAMALPLIGALHPNIGSIFYLDPGSMRVPFPGVMGLGFGGGSGLALSVLAHLVFGLTLGTLTSIQERRH